MPPRPLLLRRLPSGAILRRRPLIAAFGRMLLGAIVGVVILLALPYDTSWRWMLGFGIVGYLFKKLFYPLAPLVLAIVIGDKKGRVGVGIGKAMDTQLAIEKATRAAKKAMITVNLTKTRSIPFNVGSKYASSVVEIRPSPGRGLVAGSSVRTVLELAGVTDVTAKIMSRSKNPFNNARVAIEALRKVAAK